MTFLICTCIDPASKFLGCIPLGLSMVIMACIMAAIAGYTYYEADQYFDDYYCGCFNKQVWLILQIADAVLLFMTFIIKKKFFSRVMYVGTFIMAILGISINIHKMTDFEDDNIDDGDEENFIKWLFVFRAWFEFFVEIMICYMVYSLKKEE